MHQSIFNTKNIFCRKIIIIIITTYIFCRLFLNDVVQFVWTFWWCTHTSATTLDCSSREEKLIKRVSPSSKSFGLDMLHWHKASSLNIRIYWLLSNVPSGLIDFSRGPILLRVYVNINKNYDTKKTTKKITHATPFCIYAHNLLCDSNLINPFGSGVKFWNQLRH